MEFTLGVAFGATLATAAFLIILFWIIRRTSR